MAIVDTGGIRLRAGLPTLSHMGTQEVIARLLEEVRALQRQGEQMGLRCQSVGVACPGVLDRAHRLVLYSPNLAWHNVPLADILCQELNLPVYMENDANLYALGEYAYGMGQGRHDLICFTLGTGVGGGIVMNGRLLNGHSGWAAELGHTIVQPNGRPCGCGARGCLEAYASATGLQGILREALAQGATTMLTADDGVKSMDLAARQGDSLALAIFNEAGRYLGLGIINAVLTTGVERVVLGGGVAKGWDLMCEGTWQQIKKTLTIIDWDKLDISISQLGADAPLLGAAALAGI